MKPFILCTKKLLKAKKLIFISLLSEIITPFLFFPPSPPIYPPLFAFFQIHDLFSFTVVTRIYGYTYVLLNITCSVRVILHVCIFSGQTIWDWIYT